MRDCEARLMLVTWLDESHWIPFHWQNGVVSDQPEGGGVRDLRKFDITAASSAVTRGIVRRRKRESRVLGRDIRVGRSVCVREREREVLNLGWWEVLWRREGRRFVEDSSSKAVVKERNTKRWMRQCFLFLLRRRCRVIL